MVVLIQRHHVRLGDPQILDLLSGQRRIIIPGHPSDPVRLPAADGNLTFLGQQGHCLHIFQENPHLIQKILFKRIPVLHDRVPDLVGIDLLIPVPLCHGNDHHLRSGVSLRLLGFLLHHSLLGAAAQQRRQRQGQDPPCPPSVLPFHPKGPFPTKAASVFSKRRCSHCCQPEIWPLFLPLPWHWPRQSCSTIVPASQCHLADPQMPWSPGA